MKDDNTPTVTRRTRPISRKLRLRYENAKLLKKLNLKAKHNKPKNEDVKANKKDPDPEKHVEISRIPRIKKNKLADPPKATSKYKKRQVNKTWLPTHLWHTKRAHMTRPTEPLWRMAIPLSPTEKSYRPSHRAGGARGCIAWDVSYMSTVGCQGTEHALGNMLKLLGFAEDSNAGKARRCRAGTRFAESWVHEVEGEKSPIVPATVVWMVKDVAMNSAVASTTVNQPDTTPMDIDEQKKKVKLDRRLLIRVHPSAFQHFWLELVKAAKMQKPQVLVEDLRFEIGSIEITGPGSTEALLGVLKPKHASKESSVERVWTSLAGLNNPASLPDRSLLAFDIVDPRLNYPPRPMDLPKTDVAQHALNELIVAWPVDSVQSTPRLSQYKVRWLAGTQLPSQKAINRRKSEAGKGKAIPLTDRDPPIPVLLLASRPSPSEANAQGTWTLLLPCLCVDAVWRSLMYYPLSSGGTPRFGGLKQMQQIAFERMAPWYPGDFPGTAAGQAWENTQAEKRFDEWLRRPPSRRLAWDMLELGLGRRGELGRGWTCDWEYLFQDTTKPTATVNAGDSTRSNGNAEKELAPAKQNNKKEKTGPKPQPDRDRRRNTSSPESDAEPEKIEAERPIKLSQLTQTQASWLFMNRSKTKLPTTPALATVRIRLLSKGSPKPAARVYRLPLRPSSTLSSSQPTSTAQPSTNPVASNPSASTESAPPAGQASPSTQSTTANPSAPLTLRDKWLSLLPTSFHHSSTLARHSKPRVNHRGLAPKHVVHPYDNPTHINVIPRNAPQSVIDEFGPKPLSEADIKQRQREALMKELMKNEIGPDEKWDVNKGLVESPDESNLIGFVTSGGFNLAEGRGTAIGAVWTQRVLEGWMVEEDALQDASGRDGTGSGNIVKDRKTCEKERYLCVLRNAGESVGRLGMWELV